MRKHPYSKKIDASSGWHGGHRVSQAGSDHPVTSRWGVPSSEILEDIQLFL